MFATQDSFYPTTSPQPLIKWKMNNSYYHNGCSVKGQLTVGLALVHVPVGGEPVPFSVCLKHYKHMQWEAVTVVDYTSLAGRYAAAEQRPASTRTHQNISGKRLWRHR